MGALQGSRTKRRATRERRPWREIQRGDPAEKMVDEGCITDEVESRPDKKTAQPIRLGHRCEAAVMDGHGEGSSRAIALERWWTRDASPTRWNPSPIRRRPSRYGWAEDARLL